MAGTTYRRWILVLATGAVTLFGAAACGGSHSTAAPTPSADTPATGAVVAYLDCLRGHGVPVPTDINGGRLGGSPDPNRSGRPRLWPSGRPTALPSGWPTAFPSGRPTAFPSGLPGGGLRNLRPAGVDDATWQAAQDACQGQLPNFRQGGGLGGRLGNPAYRNCLADHGVRLGAGTNTADPKVAAAVKTCAVLNATASAQPASS